MNLYLTARIDTFLTFHGMVLDSCRLASLLTGHIQCTRLDNALCNDILDRDFLIVE